MRDECRQGEYSFLLDAAIPFVYSSASLIIAMCAIVAIANNNSLLYLIPFALGALLSWTIKNDFLHRYHAPLKVVRWVTLAWRIMVIVVVGLGGFVAFFVATSN